MRRLYFLAAGILAGLATLQPVLAQGPFTGKPRYLIQTKQGGQPLGDIRIELFPLIAPRHVANFDSLVNHQFYDSTAFHRVVPGFVIQGGDPNSRHGPRSTWGYGQPNQPKVNAEFSVVSHQRGIFSAARSSNINSATSQFFICVAPATNLDGNYSVYGKVVQGMAVVDTIVSAPRDANDNPLQKIEMFITYIGSNDSTPLAPVLVAPANNFAGGQQSQLLDWVPVSDAMLYNVQVADNPAFTNPVHEVNIKQTLSSFTATNLQPVTTYYWRVRANNGGRLSPWSVYQFATGVDAPVLVSPVTGSNAASTAQVVEWTPVTGVSSYRLQVATTPLFTPATVIFDQGGLTGPTYQLANLQLNTRYYWRVQGELNGVPGFYSPVWNFRVSTQSAVPGSALAAFSLGAAVPNPAGGLTQISFQLPAAGEADLRLFDALGRQVAVLLSQPKAAGVHQVTFDAGTLPKGVYFYRLQAGGQLLTRQFIKL